MIFRLSDFSCPDRVARDASDHGERQAYAQDVYQLLAHPNHSLPLCFLGYLALPCAHQ